jgi:hypothetical protein
VSEVVGFLDPSLIGTWASLQGEVSQVRYHVTVSGGSPCVAAIDENDGEAAEVSDVRWNARTYELLFTCYWPSTGRLAKCRFMRNPNNTVHLTYQFTDHEILVRRDA